MLRQAIYAPGYTKEAYLRTCVEIFIRGIRSQRLRERMNDHSDASNASAALHEHDHPGKTQVMDAQI